MIASSSQPTTMATNGRRTAGILGVLTLTLTQVTVSAFSLADKPVSVLLNEKGPGIAALKEKAAGLGVDLSAKPYSNDVFFLRYCLEEDEDGVDPTTTLTETISWRNGEGKAICDAAVGAIAEATAEEGGWNNEPVLKAAPGSAVISEFLNNNCLTTTSSKGDLVYCIRAGKIDDVGLMKGLNGEIGPLVDFFLYAKEVNAIVANDRSLQSDKLLSIITANDLSSVKLVGGDKSFRSALSASSKKAASLYPCLNGPTLLLNLPKLLSALVKLFTPLFPPKVKERLRFEQGPLSSIDTLADVTYGGIGRDKFLKELDDIIYDG